MDKVSVNKEVKLLQELLVKLDADNFELDAWKMHTVIIFDRIFGKDTLKIKQIEDIKYDYSSWSLRDNSGTISNIDACKTKAKEIIHASIHELESLGAPDKQRASLIKSNDSFIETTEIIKQFEDELKVSQLKELKLILSSKDKPDEKKSRLIGKLKEFGVDTAPAILSGILLKDEISMNL